MRRTRRQGEGRGGGAGEATGGSGEARRVELLTMREAVERYVRPGQWTYIGNFGSLNFSFGHEIIRRGVRGLWVVMSGGGILLDQLVGAGAVERVVVAHVWNVVGPCPAYNWRRWTEGGIEEGQVTELSLGSLNLALLAGAYGLPFVPVTGLSGTSYPAVLGAEWYRQVVDPFSAEQVGALAPLRPALGVIHAQQVDEYGNARVLGPRGEVAFAAMASEKVLIVAEELVGHEVVRERPWETVVPGQLVVGIVVEPWAAHPEGVYGYYDRDVEHFRLYGEMSRTEEGFRAYLEKFVTGVEDRAEYLRTLEREGLWSPERLRL